MPETHTRSASRSSVPACEACRALKMRCTRTADIHAPGQDLPCDRCKHNDRQCKIPPPRPLGRKPGSLGRYRGVEKALRKVQTELRKSKTTSEDLLRHPQLAQLTDGNNEVIDLLFSTDSHTHNINHQSAAEIEDLRNASIDDNLNVTDLEFDTAVAQRERQDSTPPYRSGTPISNPLGLVADAYERAEASGQQPTIATLISPSSRGGENNQEFTTGHTELQSLASALLRRPGYVSLGLELSRQTLERGLEAVLFEQGKNQQALEYFKHNSRNRARDTGPDLDPVDLGLVSMEEAEYLFPVYFARLHPVNGILDPMLHTPNFVRSRSALLFTWILAISAQFDHSSGAIFKRLRHHGEYLSKHVYASGFKSVEIAQGYYISLLSAVPAATLGDERSWLYTNYAFGVARELGLDRRSRPRHPLRRLANIQQSPQSVTEAYGTSVSQGNGSACTDADFNDRLNRNRERTWLRIVLWERAHSAARGQVSAFPDTELTEQIATWYLHRLADPVDIYTSAFILLRQNLSSIYEKLKIQATTEHTNRHWVRELVDSNLRPWCTAWLKSADLQASSFEVVCNKFLRYVYLHGRLWTLSHALRWCTPGRQGTDSTQEDCFEAAVNCCEMAVRDLQDIGEPLYCFLAPTWAMIAYAAVLALKLFPLLYGGQAGRDVELLALLAQVALQLDRAGTTPSHRFGLAALLGQNLFMILRTHSNTIRNDPDLQAQLSERDHGSTRNIGSQDVFEFHAESQHQPLDPMLSDFDPLATMPFGTGIDEFSPTGFTEGLWDWFNQGLGGAV